MGLAKKYDFNEKLVTKHQKSKFNEQPQSQRGLESPYAKLSCVSMIANKQM